MPFALTGMATKFFRTQLYSTVLCCILYRFAG
nr:MAG TPA: hypothetical protein [Caudoviricetes sp.]